MELYDYFQVVEVSDTHFHFRLGGFLDDTVLDQFGTEIIQQYQDAVDTFEGRPFINLADLRGLKPMPGRAKEMVADLMEYGKQRNLYYSINVNPSALSKMSIGDAGKMSKTSDLRVIVASMEEATRILKEKQKEIA